MNIKNILSTGLVWTDKVCDYIPGVSTVTNAVDLFGKIIISDMSTTQKHEADSSLGDRSVTQLHSTYYNHIDKKSTGRCFLLLIPVIGNILVGVYDLATKIRTNRTTSRVAIVKMPEPAMTSPENKSGDPNLSVSDK